jgi:hypothetical protein
VLCPPLIGACFLPCASLAAPFAAGCEVRTFELVERCSRPPPLAVHLPFVRHGSGSPDVDMEADAVPDAPDASLYEQEQESDGDSGAEEQERDGDSGAEEIRSPQMLPHGMHDA